MVPHILFLVVLNRVKDEKDGSFLPLADVVPDHGSRVEDLGRAIQGNFFLVCPIVKGEGYRARDTDVHLLIASVCVTCSSCFSRDTIDPEGSTDLKWQILAYFNERQVPS